MPSPQDDTSTMAVFDKSVDTSTPEKWSRSTRIQQPWKLVLEIIGLFLLGIPCILWAGVVNVFGKQKSLEDNVVLVTGAAGGLGRELCLQFAELGCKIVCVDVIDHGSEETVRQVNRQYPQVIASAYHCDISSVKEIQQLHRSVFRDFGPVDILVNNAGILREDKFLDIDDDKLDRIFNVNLKSHFLTIRQFLPDMLNRNSGHIVAISSMAAFSGVAKKAEYCATKHGVLGMMDSLYEELREIPGNAVRTTTVCPYFFRSPVQYNKPFNLRLPELSLKETAKATVVALRKNKTVVSIPSLLYFSVVFLKLLPQNLINKVRDTFYVKVN